MSLSLVKYGKRYATEIVSIYTLEKLDACIEEILKNEETRLKEEKLSLYDDYIKDLRCLFWDIYGDPGSFDELIKEFPKLREKILKHNTITIE